MTYLKTTEEALEGADCVVVLWSQLSVESNWVRDEAQSGRERGCLVPLSLDGTMAPLGFRQTQMLDISGWDGRTGGDLAQKIVTAVHNTTAAAGAAPPPPPLHSPAPSPSRRTTTCSPSTAASTA